MHPHVPGSTGHGGPDMKAAHASGVRIKRAWSADTTEHHSAARKDEMLPFATTWWT